MEERGYVTKNQKISEKIVLIYVIFKDVLLCKYYDNVKRMTYTDIFIHCFSSKMIEHCRNKIYVIAKQNQELTVCFTWYGLPFYANAIFLRF